MRKKDIDQKEDHFLSRWSEKKNREKLNLPDVQDQVDEQPEDEHSSSPDVEHSKPEPVVLTDDDMPDIEQLHEKSDYSGFLSPGVSDELRRVALRKLFRSDLFNQRDGLDDYDDDFRSFTALGDLITSDMKHQMELAEQKKKNGSIINCRR